MQGRSYPVHHGGAQPVHRGVLANSGAVVRTRGENSQGVRTLRARQLASPTALVALAWLSPGVLPHRDCGGVTAGCGWPACCRADWVLMAPARRWPRSRPTASRAVCVSEPESGGERSIFHLLDLDTHFPGASTHPSTHPSTNHQTHKRQPIHALRVSVSSSATHRPARG
jgi:hypothetical protein